jgi:hypothetical protein
MEEISATFEGAGISPDFHRGAAWVMELTAATPTVDGSGHASGVLNCIYVPSTLAYREFK